MKKAELVDAIAKETGVTKKAVNEVLDATVGVLQQALLDGDKIRFGNLGTFRTTEIPGRTGRNPGTGDPIKIPAQKRVRFKAGKEFKKLLSD